MGLELRLELRRQLDWIEHAPSGIRNIGLVLELELKLQRRCRSGGSATELLGVQYLHLRASAEPG